MLSVKVLLCGALLLTMAVNFALSGILHFPNERIHGGQLARPGQFPYIVSIMTLRQTENGTRVHHTCGGSIISERWIVTAVHCTQQNNSNPANIRVLVGATNVVTDGEVYEVERIINHPEYNSTHLLFDISLLYLSQPLEWSETVSPISLKGQTIDRGVRVLTIGWGLTEQNNTHTPVDLRYLHMYTLDDDDCRERIGNELDRYVTNTTLCTVRGAGQGVCNGDAGGPLVANNRLIGITSWTIRPCGSGIPGGFTRISVLTDWIFEISGLATA